MSNELSKLPESLCVVYENLKSFDISKNFICPPYPSCFEYIGYQNTVDCDYISCPDGYLEYDQQCYYHQDLQVLMDFTDINPTIEGYHPLFIGLQEWQNDRLTLLYLTDLGIETIPESISNLDSLQYLDLTHNELTILPEGFCKIENNLQAFDFSHNYICPPYPECFELIGYQNVDTCPEACPFDHVKINDN